jgi:hypothetical protein
LHVTILQEEANPRRGVWRHYEIMWERSEELPEQIKQAWEGLGAKTCLGDVRKGLDKVMTELHTWGKRKFGNIAKELEKARKQLELLQMNNGDQAEMRRVADHMNELLYKEEMIWLQRSRVTWLKEGDRNTKYFHQRAVWRARKNYIKKLKDDEGRWQDVPSEMERMATSYFKELFKKDPSLNANNLTSLFQEKVSAEMNESLCKDFSDEEIGDALFQIGPLKAPGTDGFPARFFQRNWATLKAEIINGVKLFFLQGTCLKELMTQLLCSYLKLIFQRL